MSPKRGKSNHLRLEREDGATLTPPSSMVAARAIDVGRVAFEHARRAGRSLADAADASQEIFLKFRPQLETDAEFLRDPETLIKYTQDAVTNWFKDQWRRRKMHDKNEQWIASLIELYRNNDFEAPTPDELLAQDEAEEAERQERLARVHASIEALPVAMRTVFKDRHVDQMTVAGTAERRGKAEGTVRQQTHRALVAIRQALGVTTKPELLP